MVLIRMRYFRQHIIAAERKKSILQSFRDRVMGKAVRLNRSILDGHFEDGSGTARHKSHGNHGIQASDGIGAAMAAGATTGIGLGIALGTTHYEEAMQPNSPVVWNESASSHIHVEIDSPLRASPLDDITIHTGDEHDRGIVADMHSFTSSPRSAAIGLHTDSPRPMQVQFATDVQSFAGGVARRRPGGYVIPCYTCSLLTSDAGVPIPRRRTIIAPPKVVYLPSNPAIGQRDKDQGLGGFPGPIQLGTRLTKKYFPHVYERLSRLFDADRPERRDGLKWVAISDGLKDLVIGRNSEFNTEELSDEQLEELGGIE